MASELPVGDGRTLTALAGYYLRRDCACDDSRLNTNCCGAHREGSRDTLTHRSTPPCATGEVKNRQAVPKMAVWR